MAEMKTDSTSVLVVGGSLVGLSSALFLAWRGVPTVLVERAAESSPHPRAIGYTARTLELFRAVGLGSSIPATPSQGKLRRVKAESLAEEWFEETKWTPAKEQAPKIQYSPCSGIGFAQDRLEPILRNRAIELGADVRLETELIRFEQDADGATAWLRKSDGSEYTMRVAYIVAADGHRSRIRTALGVGRSGRGYLRTVRSVLFRAPLEEYLQKGVSQFEIEQPGFKAFLTTYRDGRWVLMFSDDQERDAATLRNLIFKALGRSDLEVEIITTGRWEMTALIADRFSDGRVFLAGDSAHTLPPNRGGYGANTGIEDAHNLAWKLSAVLSGVSTAHLLETYDLERRPIAWLRHDQIFARDDYKAYAGENARDVPILDDDAMELGQLYRSSAVLGVSAELPPAKRPEEWAGQPGTRAPHVWIRLSIIDLFQRNWVLLAEDARWIAAAAEVRQHLSVPLESQHIGVDVLTLDPQGFRNAYGLTESGATLVRPDGYVAWRSVDMPNDPFSALREAVMLVSSSAKKSA